MKRASIAACLLIFLIGGGPAPAHATFYTQAEPSLLPRDEPGEFLDQLIFIRGYAPPDFTMQFTNTRQRNELLSNVQALYWREALRRPPLLKQQPLLLLNVLGPVGALGPSAETAIKKFGLGERWQSPPEDIASLAVSLCRLDPLHRLTEARALLEEAALLHRESFILQANLGTVYHMMGDLDLAVRSLREAIRLAENENERVLETFHLRLVGARQAAIARGEKLAVNLDDLFGVRWVGPSGSWEPGKLAVAEAAKLPKDAERLVKTLLLSFPADQRLHWLYAELLNARGDIGNALMVMNATADTLRFSPPALLERRRMLMEEVRLRARLRELLNEEIGRLKKELVEEMERRLRQPTSLDRLLAWMHGFEWWHWGAFLAGVALFYYLVRSQLRILAGRLKAGPRTG